MYEVEQKFHVDNLDDTRKKLLLLGAKPADVIVQVDQYFNHPARDFASTDEAFRIRQVGQANRVTYKGPKIDSATKTRREIEVGFADGDSHAEMMRDMFVELGFRTVSTVRKSRQPFTLAWQGTDVEIALDEVDELGVFVELEVVTEESELETAKQQVLDLAAKLNLSNAERRSYLELLQTARGDTDNQ